MTDNPTDMHIPESFHRAKRALLVNCSALLLLSLAAGDTIAINWSANTLTFPADEVKFFLWVAAVYLAAVYFVEWKTASRINSDIMQGAGPAKLNDRVAEIADKLQLLAKKAADDYDGFQKQIQQTNQLAADIHINLRSKMWDKAIEGKIAAAFRSAISQMESQPKTPEAVGGAAFALGRSLSSTLTADLLQYAESQCMSVEEAINRGGPYILEAQSKASDSAKAIVVEYARTQKDIRRLFSSIGRERKASFYILDAVAPSLIFVAGTAAVMPAICRLVVAALYGVAD